MVDRTGFSQSIQRRTAQGEDTEDVAEDLGGTPEVDVGTSGGGQAGDGQAGQRDGGTGDRSTLGPGADLIERRNRQTPVGTDTGDSGTGDGAELGPGFRTVQERNRQHGEFGGRGVGDASDIADSGTSGGAPSRGASSESGAGGAAGGAAGTPTRPRDVMRQRGRVAEGVPESAAGELRQQFAAGRTGISPGEVDVRRGDDGGYVADAAPGARREAVAERASGAVTLREIGGPTRFDEGLSWFHDPNELGPEADRRRVEAAGDQAIAPEQIVVTRTDSPERLENVSPAAQGEVQQRLAEEAPDEPQQPQYRASLTQEARERLAERSSDTREQVARARIERDLERETGADLRPGTDFEMTREEGGGYSARLTDAGQARVRGRGREQFGDVQIESPFSGRTVEGDLAVASQRYQSGADVFTEGQTAAPVWGKVYGATPFGLAIDAAAGEGTAERLASDTYETVVRDVSRGALHAVDPFAIAAGAKEGAEFAGYAASESYQGRSGIGLAGGPGAGSTITLRDEGVAPQTSEAVGSAAGSYAADLRSDPLSTIAKTGGTLAAGAGAAGAARKAATVGSGTVVSGAGAGRSAASVVSSRGSDTLDVRSNLRRLARDERAQGQIPRRDRDGDGDSGIPLTRETIADPEPEPRQGGGAIPGRDAPPGRGGGGASPGFGAGGGSATPAGFVGSTSDIPEQAARRADRPGHGPVDAGTSASMSRARSAAGGGALALASQAQEPQVRLDDSVGGVREDLSLTPMTADAEAAQQQQSLRAAAQETGDLRQTAMERSVTAEDATDRAAIDVRPTPDVDERPATRPGERAGQRQGSRTRTGPMARSREDAAAGLRVGQLASFDARARTGLFRLSRSTGATRVGRPSGSRETSAGAFRLEEPPAFDSPATGADDQLRPGWLSETVTRLAGEEPTSPSQSELEAESLGYRGAQDLPTEQVASGDRDVAAVRDVFDFGLDPADSGDGDDTDRDDDDGWLSAGLGVPPL